MSYKYVKAWRNKIKSMLVDAFGGCCCICGYNTCNAALHFHHVSSDKEFNLSGSKINNLQKIISEAKKCICVCSNCHAEIHYGLKLVPKNVTRFNSRIFKIQSKITLLDKCAVCNNLKLIKRKYCSRKCTEFKKRKINWDQVNVHDLWLQMGYEAAGRKLGVSGTTVKKWHLKQINGESL